jgi:hypothetical protein
MQFIQVYQKAFSDEFCNKAIESFKVAEEGGIAVNRQDHDGVAKTDKQDLAVFVPHIPLHHAHKDLLNEFNSIFWGECYKRYVDQFDIIKEFSHHNSYTMKIQKTQPGQGYHMWHAEQSDRNSGSRLLTWTVYLNDDFEAGETEFLYQHYRYKPQKGDCIIFPAAYTHTHRGNPPIGGDKYIITGWVEF